MAGGRNRRDCTISGVQWAFDFFLCLFSKCATGLFFYLFKNGTRSVVFSPQKSCQLNMNIIDAFYIAAEKKAFILDMPSGHLSFNRPTFTF